MPNVSPLHKPNRKKFKSHASSVDVRKKWHHMYGARWQKYRKVYLIENPVCACDDCVGKLTPAIVVDHIVPHRGDYDLFWDPKNHQPLAKRCHDKKTRAEVLARS